MRERFLTARTRHALPRLCRASPPEVDIEAFGTESREGRDPVVKAWALESFTCLHGVESGE
jgi:hypothetical protein